MNILGMGPMELLLIVVLALIVFGPARLPEIMGQVGKAINDFRRATSELSDEFNRTIQAELQETRSMIDETKSAVSDVQATVNSAVKGIPAPTRTVVPAEALPAPVANGVTSELHADNGTNGTVQTAEVPLADTTQWSWETAAPSDPAPAPPAAAAVAPPAEMDEPNKPSDTASPASPPTQERAAHDELLPPY